MFSGSFSLTFLWIYVSIVDILPGSDWSTNELKVARLEERNTLPLFLNWCWFYFLLFLKKFSIQLNINSSFNRVTLPRSSNLFHTNSPPPFRPTHHPSLYSKGRGDRLKAAKAESAEVINAYRQQKDLEFQTSILSTGDGDSQQAKVLEQQTTEAMGKMKKDFEDNSKKGLQTLLSKVCEVNLDVPSARVRSAQKAAAA